MTSVGAAFFRGGDGDVSSDVHGAWSRRPTARTVSRPSRECFDRTEPPDIIESTVERGRKSLLGRVYAVFLPYGMILAADSSSKSLISLARPTGIEPVFPP